MKPILSVVVASYNVEEYLDKCLSSFSDERFNDILQVIVVNDGSTDSTADIAKKYEDKFPRIFDVINKENGGHGSAVNAGVDNAKGKYFRIVDGDDWINTEDFYKLLCALKDTDSDLVVDQKREVNKETGETKFFKTPNCVEYKKEYEFKNICNIFELSPYIMIHTLSVKTSILKENKIKLLEHIFYVDIEFIIKSTVNAKTIEFLDLEIYQYLVGNADQSVNYKNYVKRFSHHSKVTRELIDFATNFKGDEKIVEYLKIRIKLLINTHMTIALIYNENRKEGLKQAKEFREYLKGKNKYLYMTTKKRYLMTLMLHFLGIDFNKLEKLKGILNAWS